MWLWVKAAFATLAGIAAIAGYHTVAPGQSREQCLTPKWSSLRLYQSLMYRGKPDLSSLGFAPAHIVDRNIWTDEKAREEVSLPKLRTTVARFAQQGGLVVLDIEHFALRGSDREVQRSVDQLVSAADAARQVAGPALVGYYGMVPLSEYWRPINGLPQGGFREWREDNRRISPIAASVDVNLPSLYTHYNDRDGWVRQAKALVCEARLMSDKPVIAFIWPEFHPGSTPAGGDVPADYWRLQLETLAEIADGVVIWGGYDMANERARVWDDKAPWWRETLRFMERHRENRSLRPVG